MEDSHHILSQCVQKCEIMKVDFMIEESVSGETEKPAPG